MTREETKEAIKQRAFDFRQIDYGMNIEGEQSAAELPNGCNPQWTEAEPIEVELTITMKG